MFFSEASRLVDYLILDCNSDMMNIFTPAAIEAADLVIRVLTPDFRGLHYLKAHKPLLTDEKFHYEKHLTFAGLARPFHPIEEMGHQIGGFDGLLPYTKEMERMSTGGQCFRSFAYCNPRYMDALKLVRNTILKIDTIPLGGDST